MNSVIPTLEKAISSEVKLMSRNTWNKFLKSSTAQVYAFTLHVLWEPAAWCFLRSDAWKEKEKKRVNLETKFYL